MNTQNLTIQDYRLIRRMAPLMPIEDALLNERGQIDALDFSKITTFITQRPIIKSLAFYYLYHNKVIDDVKVFTAENIKDIYFHEHADYKSFYDFNAPIILITLGTEMYNQQMITILNLFVENFLAYPKSKALIFGFIGTSQDFKFKYKDAQDRGVLNSGKTVVITKTPLRQKTKSSTETSYEL